MRAVGLVAIVTQLFEGPVGSDALKLTCRMNQSWSPQTVADILERPKCQRERCRLFPEGLIDENIEQTLKVIKAAEVEQLEDLEELKGLACNYLITHIGQEKFRKVRDACEDKINKLKFPVVDGNLRLKVPSSARSGLWNVM